MKLHTLKLRGLSVAFPREVEVDFRTLGPGVVCIVGGNGCLAGDTMIDVPRDLSAQPQGVPIRDLVGTEPRVYAYDAKAGRIVLAKARDVRRTGTLPVVRVKLDVPDVPVGEKRCRRCSALKPLQDFTIEHGKPGRRCRPCDALRRKRPRRSRQHNGHHRFAPPRELIGTADHPVMLRDGTWCRLGNLKPGDRLMPLHRRIRDGKYVWINRNDGHFELEHRMVAREVGGDNPEGLHVHHVNENTFDNRPENLCVLDGRIHSAHHAKDRPPTYDEHPRGMLGKRHSPDARRRISETVRKRIAEIPERMVHARLEGVRRYWESRKRPWTDETLLRKLYLDEELSTVEIGRQLGCSDVCVGVWLKKRGIPARPAGGPQNHKVVSIEPWGTMDVYDMEVPDYHNFVANGVVVHNSGKSHLLETSGPGVLYREYPSYGESFAAHVIEGCRDAFAELTFEIGGHVYRALVQADPLFGGGRGKTEGYLFRDGEPIAGPLVKDYDGAIAKILPPRDIFLATVFAAQGGGGSFFAMPKAARKDMFAQLLGLEHLQEYAERARELARIALTDLDRCQADLEAARGRQQQHAEISGELALTEAALSRATAERIDLVKDRDAKRTLHAAAVAELAKVKAQAESIARERELIDRDLRAAREERDKLAARKGVIEATLAQEPAVIKAEAEIKRLTDEQRRLTADLDAATKLGTEAQTKLATASERRNSLVAEYRRLSDELAKATNAAAEVEALADRSAKLKADQARVADLEAEATAADAEVARLQQAADREAENDRRRQSLQEKINDNEARTVSLGAIDAEHPMCAICPLTEDARGAAQAAEEARAELAAIPESTGAAQRLQVVRDENVTRRAELSTRRTAVEALRSELAEAEAQRALANRKPEIEAELAANKDSGAQQKAAIEAATSARDDAELCATELRTKLQRIETDLADRRGAAAPRSAVDAAKAEAPTIEAELAHATQRVAALEAERAALAAPVDIAPYSQAEADASADLDAATYAVEEIDRVIAGHTGTVERCNGALGPLGAPADDVERLGRREKSLAEAAADWSLLEKALGRDGIQALEIDAAGPGVTSLANELLASCYGNRFSLAIETTAVKKGGGLKEVFDVRILDAQNGRDAKQGSGGEMVILDEALRLALAIYQTQQSGYELRTLWRDETAGALSPENADRYVQMLRRARELGGFEQVLFIAHSPDVWQQADARLFVEAGTVTPDAIAEAADGHAEAA